MCFSEKRAVDEEIVAVVETDACFSDAVQVMTGCTFGKGDFIISQAQMNRTIFQGHCTIHISNGFDPRGSLETTACRFQFLPLSVHVDC